MAHNILLTGAAGYIGGTILKDLLELSSGSAKTAKLFAAVRTDEQVQLLSKLGAGVTALRIDLTDRTMVGDVIHQNEINFVVHLASSVDPSQASNLIHALGHHRSKTQLEDFFIHSSVTQMFAEENGWSYGEVRDTDQILPMEKAIAVPNPARSTNILIAEKGKANNVKTYNVAVPVVYGRGTGEGRKQSVNISAFVRSSLKYRTVYKFDKDAKPPSAHVSDVSALYVLLIDKILQGEPILSGEHGYYFAMAHRLPWWKVMGAIAESLHSRGLVDSAEPQVWPSYDMAAESLGYPRKFIRGMGTSTGDLVPVNAYKLGWEPKWDEQRCIDRIDDEVTDAIELDTGGTSLYDAIMPSKA